MSPGNKKKHGKAKTATSTSPHIKTNSPVTETTTNLSESHPDDTPSRTNVAFRDFIKLADIDTINSFLSATTSILESENLEVLWKRAYEEGYERGRKMLLEDIRREMEDMYDEGLARGKDLGREEGYTIAKEAFDNMVMQLKARDAPKISTNDTSTQTDPLTTATASISVQTNPTTFADTSQSPTPSEIAKKPENLLNYSEISPKVAVFSFPTPYVTFSESTAPPMSTTALETRPTTSIFSQKQPKTEKSSISTQTTPQPPSTSTTEPTNEVTRAYTSSPTPNDVILQHSAPPTSASSSSTPYPAGQEKCELLGAISESQQCTATLESTTPFPTTPVPETPSTTLVFIQKQPKVEKAPISTQTNSPVTPTYNETSSPTPSAPTTVVTALESCPATTSFTEIHQKIPIFSQNHPEALEFIRKIQNLLKFT
jgi:hypothetical protein